MPKDKEVRLNLQLQRMLCDAAWDGDARAIAHLLTHPDVDPAADHSTALMHAAHRGKVACVRLLIPVSNPLARNSEALWRAARYGRASCVRALMGVSHTEGWEAWQWDELPASMQRLLKRTSSRID